MTTEGRRWPIACAIAAFVWGAAPIARPIDAASLVHDPSVRAALAIIKATETRTIADQVRLCGIPAPSFKEAARGQAVRREFEQLGLSNVRVDPAGNVLGVLAGPALRPRLVVAAHLDTVFAEGTDVRVTRQGAVLRGPGIGDNCRGLATLLATIRALRRARVRPAGSITFVADVGEEGLGNLRGVKELVDRTLKGQIDRFVSIDGAGLYLANIAVGSHRYRVTFKGPGGHSFADFGTANPVQAMGRAIAKIAALPVPRVPRATFNVGRVEGGTAVNAIPSECWMEIDLRSSDAGALASLDDAFRRAVDAGVAEENERWGTPGAVTADPKLVGARPAGLTPADSPIVRTALDAARALALTVVPSESSTDANVPIEAGIPAITIGTGGRGRHAHALDETFDTTEAWKGAQYALLLTVALSQ